MGKYRLSSLYLEEMSNKIWKNFQTNDDIKNIGTLR